MLVMRFQFLECYMLHNSFAIPKKYLENCQHEYVKVHNIQYVRCHKLYNLGFFPNIGYLNQPLFFARFCCFHVSSGCNGIFPSKYCLHHILANVFFPRAQHLYNDAQGNVALTSYHKLIAIICNLFKTSLHVQTHLIHP